MLTRRAFVNQSIIAAGAIASAVSFSGIANAASAEDVSPAEDLMREHGVLKRVLLIYGEVERRISANVDFPPENLKNSAEIIRDFIEAYHEKLEENYLFPRFEKAHTLTDLVAVLKLQHERGRILTGQIIQHANTADIKDSAVRGQVASDLAQFVRMYNPHEAREDTVLFPAFRKIVSKTEYAKLGDQFEGEEHKRFGEDGFEHMVDRVATIEKALGIYDLAQFTPT
jgi:hemerythrin-like domain-containing protein